MIKVGNAGHATSEIAAQSRPITNWLASATQKHVALIQHVERWNPWHAAIHGDVRFLVQNSCMVKGARREDALVVCCWCADSAIWGALSAYNAVRGDDATDVVKQLVALQPALLVLEVGEQHPEWQRIAREAKLSPATRKIPILAVARSQTALAKASGLGPDALVVQRSFIANPDKHVRAHARFVDDVELARQAALPLPPKAAHGVDLFNRGEYFEQHEAFEHAWRAEPGPVRALYQGVLQVGVAYLQIQRGNFDGALKMFQRARQYLKILPDVCQSIDVAQLRADANAAQAALEGLGPNRIADFDRKLMAPLALHMDIDGNVFCRQCSGTFNVRGVLERARRYWPMLDVTLSTRPCCGGSEDVQLRPGQVLRGYVYGAGSPHFSPEETYWAPTLTSVRAGLDGVEFVLNGRRFVVPAHGKVDLP